MSTRRRLLAIAAIAIVAFGWWYGQGIVPRLSNHRGYQLIAVDDRVSEAAAAAYAPVRPRRVFLVLVDGLRADVAATLGSVQKLRAAGVCRRTHVSLPTVSRPVYALVSTGVEQDRSGARNNDESSPLAAESIWQVARAAGRRVAGVSVLTWWRELWPDGFDRYEKLAPEDDLFARAARADEDLVLVHPAYVDEAGHEHGGASRQYHEAAVRADRELGELLAQVDFSRDVVLVTADHGHSDAGGHGGDAPEVATTLTCYAGPGVVRREGGPLVDMQERSIGPLVAVLAGLRFPRHMRPGLGDAVWDDLAAGLPAAYVAERRAAEGRFAAASASLPQVYRSARRLQHLRGGAVLLAAALAFAFVARRRGLDARASAALAAWLLGVVALHIAVYVVVRGSFDMTSINQRAGWIRASMLLGVGVGALGLLVPRRVFRTRPRTGLVADQLTLAMLGVAGAAAHAAAYGWVFGFPLPGAYLLFFPFFAAAYIIAHGVVALLAAAWPRGD